MANEARTVKDPLGHTVYILAGTCLPAGGKDSEEVYDDITAVIKKPALLISMDEDHEELYYFRSTGWHHTLLLRVHYINERWEAAECYQDPSASQLSDVLRRGKQLM